MTDRLIAFAIPELHGDVLWSVPAARGLAEKHGCKVDFWLSRWGANTADLLRAQSFVREVHVDPTFERRPGEAHYCTVPGGYSVVYQLGFTPGIIEETLLDHFCRRAGVPRQGHWFDLPGAYPTEILPDAPFVALACKRKEGWMWQRWGKMWEDFVRHCPLPIVEVDDPGFAAFSPFTLDRCRPGFLEMAGIISRCKAFVGTISAPLVVADAFPNVVRVALHDGHSWDLRSCTKSGLNHYPVTDDYRDLLRYVA